MLTAAAIRCTVGLWPLAAIALAAGEGGDIDASERRDCERPEPGAADAEDREPRRPT
ncbi:hypothetical protein J5226_15655 [Lysobacter sp. K5869]|uniref:hypothetical protein n=1 Tax=Lysobacter sp. K5869 TaxID=2820808 RepID=UPI001C0638C8|nr:hypothetical protein [Lysobacter sp. K5869]QWP75068.1 hypothetical protein J5226_15655 [Lysobacter sp. K5869]